jgi:hypothetical protein
LFVKIQNSFLDKPGYLKPVKHYIILYGKFFSTDQAKKKYAEVHGRTVDAGAGGVDPESRINVAFFKE